MTAAGGATAVRETGRTVVANVDAVARDEMRRHSRYSSAIPWCRSAALHCLWRLGKIESASRLPQ